MFALDVLLLLRHSRCWISAGNHKQSPPIHHQELLQNQILTVYFQIKQAFYRESLVDTRQD